MVWIVHDLNPDRLSHKPVPQVTLPYMGANPSRSHQELSVPNIDVVVLDLNKPRLDQTNVNTSKTVQAVLSSIHNII